MFVLQSALDCACPQPGDRQILEGKNREDTFAAFQLSGAHARRMGGGARVGRKMIRDFSEHNASEVCCSVQKRLFSPCPTL